MQLIAVVIFGIYAAISNYYGDYCDSENSGNNCDKNFVSIFSLVNKYDNKKLLQA